MNEDIVLHALQQAGAPGLAQVDLGAQGPMEVPDIILDIFRAMVAEDSVEDFFPGLIASVQAQGMIALLLEASV